jgi:hypothetical protein
MLDFDPTVSRRKFAQSPRNVKRDRQIDYPFGRRVLLFGTDFLDVV